jgi:uncharacterized membrane protein YoaK (UPF0700 family)
MPIALSSPLRGKHRIAWLGAILAALGGCVDTLGFITLFKVFTSHVTGNIATLFAGFTEPHLEWWLKVEVLVAFFAGTFMARLISEPALRRRHNPLPLVLAWEAAWLLAAWCAILLGLLPTMPASPATWLAIWCAGAAMGTQSALSKLPTGLAIQTNVMTSIFTQAALAFAAMFVCGPGQRPDAVRALGHDSLPVLCFATGAGIGALLAVHFGFAGIVVPGAVAALLAWATRRA